jgi:hypothetical protein
MGSSDSVGFKAISAEDALAFLGDPKGKPFLFMGPDLICFLKDMQSELGLGITRQKMKRLQGEHCPPMRSRKYRAWIF